MKVFNNKKMKVGFVFCIVFVILSILLIVNIDVEKVSATTLTNQEIDKISEGMTESINFDVSGEKKSLEDYPSYLHNRFQLSNWKYDVLNVVDEWIEKLVPKVLFTQKIEDYFYVGDKYGFYFDYNSLDDTYLVYFIKHFNYYRSGNLERKIEPLYYEQYVFNEETETVSLVYMDYFIYPDPENLPYYKEHCYHYRKHSNYEKLYIKDVNFTANLYNENHLNVGDNGYDPNTDNGGYFIGNQYYFKGVSTQSGKSDFFIETFKMGIGYIPLGTTGLAVGDALNITSFISEFANFVNVAKNDFRDTISNEDMQKFIDIKDKLLAADQIRESGGLFKSAGIQFVTGNDKEAVLYGINNENYVTNKYQIMNKDQSTAWNSRFSGKITLDIVREVPNAFGSTVVDIATVESNDWYYSIDSGYSTEIELYEDNNQIYILNDAKHKVSFTAPVNGIYTIKTFGNVKNTLKYLDVASSAIDENNQQLILDLDKDEEIFVDVTKDNFIGSEFVGIKVEFTPEEIEKGLTKTITIEAGEKEYVVFNSDSISFNYNCLNANDNIELEFSKNTYYNSIYSHSGQEIFGSILHEIGKYYISIKNNGNVAQSINLKILDVEELDIESNNNLNVMYRNVYSLQLPYTMDVTLSADYESHMLLEVYNNSGDRIANATDSSINKLNFRVLANQKFFVMVKHLSNTNASVIISFEKHIQNLLNYNTFYGLNMGSIMLYKNDSYSAEYFIDSDVDFTIYDNQYNILNANSDTSYTLLKNQNYYFYIKENKNQGYINFNIKYTTALNGTFTDSEVVFIQFIPTQAGNYNITGITNYAWYSETFGNIYGELSANETYYMMIEGAENTNYDVSIELDANRTEIPFRTDVSVKTGQYCFTVEVAGNYLFRTFKEYASVSSIITLYDQNDIVYLDSICTDSTHQIVSLSAGIYYLDLVTTPSLQSVTIRILNL